MKGIAQGPAARSMGLIFNPAGLGTAVIFVGLFHHVVCGQRSPKDLNCWFSLIAVGVGVVVASLGLAQDQTLPAHPNLGVLEPLR